eukprot:m.67142 g.67142  ORF g.67142 m.67142 type:complete len:296 (-) comp18170_c0_seq1:35-922(-)
MGTSLGKDGPGATEVTRRVTEANGGREHGVVVATTVPVSTDLVPAATGVVSLSRETLEHIFTFLPHREVVHCSEVCSLWYEVLNPRAYFWLHIAKLLGPKVIPPSVYTADPGGAAAAAAHDLRQLIVALPLNRELAGEILVDSLDQWEGKVTKDWDNGSGFAEEVYAGVACLASTYNVCTLLRRFEFAGMDFLVGMPVDITLTLNVATRSDQSGTITVRAGFGRALRAPALPTAERHLAQSLAWHDEVWLVERVQWCPNLYVEISSQDAQFWRGHYGPKISRISVVVTTSAPDAI